MSKEHFYSIILSPAITEKGTLVSAHNQIVFNVARDGR
jgi:large subunit ribosomal protein L23